MKRTRFRIKKHPNGKYYIHYYQDGVRQRKGFDITQLKDAERKVDELIAECSNKQEICASKRFHAYLDEFLEWSKLMHKEKTHEGYRETVTRLKRHFDNTLIDQIRFSDLDLYVQKTLEFNFWTCRKDIIHIKRMFSRALELEYIITNPCVKLKQLSMPEIIPNFFTREDLETLYQRCDKELKDVVIFAVNTGMRAGEIINLSWSQIDLGARVVRLNNRRFRTKTNKVRSIPLNKHCIKILNELPRMDPIFKFNNRPIQQDWLSHKFKKVVRECKLEGRFHDLRHTFATLLLREGVQLKVISQLLGHSSIKTTEIYAHVMPESTRGAVDLL